MRQLDVVGPVLECVRERVPDHMVSYNIFGTSGGGARGVRGLSITRSSSETKRERTDGRKEREQERKLKKH